MTSATIYFNEKVVGLLTFEQQKNRWWSTFKYANEWLNNGFNISPDLDFDSVMQFFSETWPRVFTEQSPNGFGRSIINKNSDHFLTEWDYQLFVPDKVRLGGFQWKVDDSFLGKDNNNPLVVMDYDHVLKAFNQLEKKYFFR